MYKNLKHLRFNALDFLEKMRETMVRKTDKFIETDKIMAFCQRQFIFYRNFIDR
jgi:hypothetical protein